MNITDLLTLKRVPMKELTELTIRKMAVEKDITYRLSVALETELSSIRDEYGNIPQSINVHIQTRATLGSELVDYVFDGVTIEL